METRTQRTNNLIKSLLQAPHQFSLLQTILLLEKDYKLNLIGSASLNMPLGEIESINLPKKSKKPTLTISTHHHHLTGINGALAIFYSENILQEAKKKQYELKDFLDLFNHQFIYLHYLASKKSYWLYNKKLLKKIMRSLTGTHHQQNIPEYYLPLLMPPTRTAYGLQAILQSHFSLPCQIQQFTETTIRLEKSQLTNISDSFHRSQHNQLGINAILGNQIKDYQYHFTVILGPLDYKTYHSLLPNQQKIHQIIKYITEYTEHYLTFNLQLHLNHHSVPTCKIKCPGGYRLGWDSWLHATINNENKQITIQPNI